MKIFGSWTHEQDQQRIEDMSMYLSSCLIADDENLVHQFLSLLSRDAAREVVNSRHISTCPLLFVAQSSATTKVLLEYGADAHLRDTKTNNTIFHLLAGAVEETPQWGKLKTCVEHSFEQIQVFSLRNNEGQSILDRALECSVATKDPSSFFLLIDGARGDERQQWIENNPNWSEYLMCAMDGTNASASTSDPAPDIDKV